MSLKHHHPAVSIFMGLAFTQGIPASVVKTENDVRSYVLKNTVVTHPEEREAAFRWTRNVSTNYLGTGLQLTKGGIF